MKRGRLCKRKRHHRLNLAHKFKQDYPFFSKAHGQPYAKIKHAMMHPYNFHVYPLITHLYIFEFFQSQLVGRQGLKTGLKYPEY